MIHEAPVMLIKYRRDIMKLSDKSVTTIIIITAVLWLAINLSGWTGHHMVGMYLSVILMLLYMILGIAKQGIVSKKFFLYPLLVWSIAWMASFFLAEHYSVKFAGNLPDFTVLGFHPSFAPVVILYWLGGILTLTLGFIYYKDEWLSEKDWNDFKIKIEAIEKEERGSISG